MLWVTQVLLIKMCIRDRDNALQGKIDQEAQARTSADQVLQNNIDSEATARAAQVRA